ncbi:hypothetical protein BgiBS90_000697, partial [Biomphalaria glabrata]
KPRKASTKGDNTNKSVHWLCPLEETQARMFTMEHPGRENFQGLHSDYTFRGKS